MAACSMRTLPSSHGPPPNPPITGIETAAATAGPFADAGSSKVDYTAGRYKAKADCRALRSLTTAEFTVVNAAPVDGACRVSGVIPGEIRFEGPTLRVLVPKLRGDLLRGGVDSPVDEIPVLSDRPDLVDDEVLDLRRW